MNILFIVDGLRAGGAGRVVSRLANKMDEKGYGVYVLGFFSNKVEYNLNGEIQFTSFVGNDGANHDSFLRRVNRIRHLCRENKIEGVVSFLTEINVYSIIAGIGNPWCTIISERNNPYIEPKDKRVRVLRDLFYRFADGYVFQTEDARRYFSKQIIKRGVVIANPVAEDIPDPYIGVRSKRIVAVGRLAKQKNYPMAINAFAKICDSVPDYSFEIYGDGPEREVIYSLIKSKKLEDRIQLMGHQKDVLNLIKDADLYIMSSDYEGMPNALMEAMAIGIPVISTNHPIGGAAMLIENGKNGLLVPVNNSDLLAYSILRMINNRDEREDMAASALTVREKFNINAISDEWERYIRRVIFKVKQRN